MQFNFSVLLRWWCNNIGSNCCCFNPRQVNRHLYLLLFKISTLNVICENKRNGFWKKHVWMKNFFLWRCTTLPCIWMLLHRIAWCIKLYVSKKSYHYDVLLNSFHLFKCSVFIGNVLWLKSFPANIYPHFVCLKFFSTRRFIKCALDVTNGEWQIGNAI